MVRLLQRKLKSLLADDLMDFKLPAHPQDDDYTLI